MGHFSFELTAVLPADTAELFLSWITDLQIGTYQGETVLYSLTRAGGGVAVFSLEGGISLLDTWATDPNLANVGTPELSLISDAGDQTVLAVGYGGDAFLVHDDSDTSWTAIETSGLDEAVVSNIEVITAGTTDFLFGTLRTGGLVTIDLASRTSSPVALPSDMNEAMSDLKGFSLDGESYLIATYGSEDKIAVYFVEESGIVTFCSAVGVFTGLGINASSLVETFELGGEIYAVVGSSLSSSLTLMRIETGGVLSPLHQLNDTSETRFNTLSVLETVVYEGRAFVVAGGSDDGLSLFTVLPDGRLQYLSSVTDTYDTTLNNISALELLIDGDSLRVFVTSETDVGLTEFAVDLSYVGVSIESANSGGRIDGGSLDDILCGKDGDDRIYGGSGDDIIFDGAGSDQMSGGTGADVFIISRDDVLDVITDFQATYDTLDVTAFGVHSADDVLVVPRSYGADIVFGTEVLQIVTRNGIQLTVDEVKSSLVFPDQISVDGEAVLSAGPVTVPEDNVPFYGTDAADFVESSAEDDIIYSGDGDDVVYGLGGNDLILAEGGDDTVYGGDADDIIYGGDGADMLHGEAGNDLIYGDGFNASYDEISAIVFRLYGATLGRLPDTEGLVHWNKLVLSDEISLEEMAESFIISNEFQSQYAETTNSEYIVLLFNNVLGRDPAASGLEAWVKALDAGMTRSEATYKFSESPENQLLTFTKSQLSSYSAIQADWADDVYRLYRTVFNRDPDLQGFKFWCEYLANGARHEDVAQRFVSSAEFSKVYGDLENTQFVELLYHNVLGREADENGLTHWVNLLETGARTIGQVVLGFAKSTEFVSKSSDMLISFIQTRLESDTLYAETGKDTLVGGMGSDTFVFERDVTHDATIVDLELWDYLSFQGFGYDDSIEALSHFSISDDGVRFYDQGSSVMLYGISLDEISVDMIIL